MQKPAQDEVLAEKIWRSLTALEKSEILTAFLNEFGENPTWDECPDFTNKHRVKNF